MRALVLMTLVPILWGCGSEATTSPPTSSKAGAARDAEVPSGPLVAFLGDSICAGLHADADQAFPAVLQRRLAERDAPFRLLNAGVSGDTSAGGLRRVDWILGQEPDVLVVELGGNDGLRGLPLESIEDNLDAIVERAQRSEVRVLLLGLVLPPNYGQDYTDGFAALYQRIAADRAVALVPYFMEGVGGVPEMNQPDGLHPTAAGHIRLAENVEEALAVLLTDL